MASEGDPKIRRVAIVFQSIDADTARKLLAQFPADVARVIKRTLANLGPVSPAERAAATQELQQLIGKPANASRTSTSNAFSSPAAQVLQQQTSFQDAIHLSPEAQQVASQSFSTDAPPSAFASNPADASNHAWLDVPPQILAGLLQNERPIVVAAVLHELPVIMATAVLQQLPIPLATETMAALPNLHRHDATVLSELLDQIKSKVREAMRNELQSHSGLEKLKAIVANAPTDQRYLWTSALGVVDPRLPSALGWDRDASPTAKQVTEPKFVSESKDANVVSSKDSNKDSESEEAPATLSIRSVEPDRQFSSWRDLMQLDDADFVTVLHSVDPNSILLALSNAEPRVLQRVERLIPKKDVRRFRDRIRQLSDVTLREIDDACEVILASAESLAAKGRIRFPRTSKRTSSSFSAAA